MNRLACFMPGIAVLVVGIAKVWTHTQSLQAFLSVRWGPEGVSSAPSGATFWTSLFSGHCWGCPASFAGGVMILVAAAMQFKPAAASALRARQAGWT